ncbi:MAG: helix-turn-helix transcriptional regulator [Paludibacteraceae bacterium]|nr:helix-turn-helix transcriptional regulator [Paludibacteraceae bacterium]MBQ6984371.1 helix-turn-helix transcriptional regulator [Paludibacteraceae bacterium]
MSHEEDAIQIISRFGLEMGVGDQTIEQVCATHGVHTPTFLAVVNFKVFKDSGIRSQESGFRNQPSDIDIPTLQRYLQNSHTYFLDFRLPRLRRALIEAIIPADPTTKIPGLILRCYDEFVEEIRTHIDHENAGLFDEHQHDDQRITDKLTEIKNLIIKYYPTQSEMENGKWKMESGKPLAINYLLISVMSDLWHTEQDFADHCAIEDEILRPALKRQMIKGERLKVKGVSPQSEELSEREKDVLIQVVRGLSNKEIADVLCISQHTVISHRKNITRKLNIHSTAGLTIYAIVNKLVDLNTLE